MTELDDAIPATWHQMKKTILENTAQLPKDASADAHRAETHSQVRMVRAAFADAAIQKAKTADLKPGSFEAWGIMEAASAIADEIVYPAEIDLPFNMEDRAALKHNEVAKIFSITSSTDHRDLMARARQGKTLNLGIESFEGGVGSYMRSEYRIPIVDRIIVTALLDHEITAYLKSIMAPDIFSKQSPFDAIGGGRHPVRMWLRGQGKALLIYLLCITAAIGLQVTNVVSAETTFIAIMTTIGIATTWMIICFIVMVIYTPKWRKQMPMLVDLPQEMRQLYREIHAPGPISVKRIRAMAQDLNDKGAVWPSSFWAMLDDIDARNIISLNG